MYRAPDSTASAPSRLMTTVSARVHRHDARYGLSTLQFADGELRVPMVTAPVGAALLVSIDARDVSVALTRPMDVSITNRLPGVIIEVERLDAPYARIRFDLGSTQIDSLVTWESVERLALQPDLKAWAMIKSVAIGKDAIQSDDAPSPRPWPPARA